MHNSQCFFNIAFVSCTKIAVLFFLGSPAARSAALARKKTSLSGSNIRTTPANADSPAAVQKRALHEADTSGTKYKLITAAKRYPTA